VFFERCLIYLDGIALNSLLWDISQSK